MCEACLAFLAFSVQVIKPGIGVFLGRTDPTPGKLVAGKAKDRDTSLKGKRDSREAGKPSPMFFWTGHVNVFCSTLDCISYASGYNLIEGSAVHRFVSWPRSVHWCFLPLIHIPKCQIALEEKPAYL